MVILNHNKPAIPFTPSPNPNSSFPAIAATDAGAAGISISGGEEDDILHNSSSLSREELLRRRSRRTKQLSQCYARQYWALVEELRVKHRDYYWEFGLSPFEDDIETPEAPGVKEENGGGGSREERKKCGFSMCKSKAMPLTRFCHQHILSDSKQTLYKACNNVTKSGQGTVTTCGKPVLRSAIPSLCHVHYQKVQRNISQALRKAGYNLPSSKPPPKFNVLIAKYIHQIQARRREVLSVQLGDINNENDNV